MTILGAILIWVLFGILTGGLILKFGFIFTSVDRSFNNNVILPIGIAHFCTVEPVLRPRFFWWALFAWPLIIAYFITTLICCSIAAAIYKFNNYLRCNTVTDNISEQDQDSDGHHTQPELRSASFRTSQDFTVDGLPTFSSIDSNHTEVSDNTEHASPDALYSETEHFIEELHTLGYTIYYNRGGLLHLGMMTYRIGVPSFQDDTDILVCVRGAVLENNQVDNCSVILEATPNVYTEDFRHIISLHNFCGNITIDHCFRTTIGELRKYACRYLRFRCVKGVAQWIIVAYKQPNMPLIADISQANDMRKIRME